MYLNVAYCYLATCWQQARLEDDELALRLLDEVGKAPRQSALRVVEQCVYGAHEGIATIEEPRLVGFPRVEGRSVVELRDRHHGYGLVPCGVGGVALVVEPVASYNTYGVRGLRYVVDNVLAVFRCKHVGAVDRIAAEYRVAAIVYGARLAVVKAHPYLAKLRAGIYLAPLGFLAQENVLDVLYRYARVEVLVVADKRHTIVGKWHCLGQHVKAVLDIGVFLRGEVACGYSEPRLLLQEHIDAVDLVGVDWLELGVGALHLVDVDKLVDDRAEALVAVEAYLALRGGVGASVLALLLATARHHDEHHSEEREDGYVLEINLHSCINVNNNPMDIYNVEIVFSSGGPWGWS